MAEAAQSRRMLVALTTDGHQMIETLSPQFNRFETEHTASLDEDEKRQLADLLRRIIVDISGNRA